MSGPLLITDAPHLLYRAFYALPDSITGPDGQPVNALLGSVNATLQVIEEHKPRAVVHCFGAEAADYRTEAYPAYHAHRPEMPEGLAVQWAQARAFYEAFGWTVLDHDGLEADDLMHSLALAEERRGGSALIFTGDRDMFQCVTDKVHVLMQQARKGFTEMGPKEVKERYGIGPELVPDFIALRGDPSDGLPGAKGIGEKTAADILQRKGDLEHAILGAIREKPSVRRALIEQAAELRSFKAIATLVEIEMDPVPDAPTDAEGGAKAAEALGMKRAGRAAAEGLAGRGLRAAPTSPPASRAWRSERSTRSLNSLGSSPRQSAQPTETVISTVSGPTVKGAAAIDRRSRSAARKVPSRSVSGSIIRNPGPSQRTITSPLRSVCARRAPVSWSTASPASGPSSLKPSTAALTTARACPWRVERATKRSSSRSPSRRLPRPVSGSERASGSAALALRLRWMASAPATAASSSAGCTGSGRQVCAPARSRPARSRGGTAPLRTITGATGRR